MINFPTPKAHLSEHIIHVSAGNMPGAKMEFHVHWRALVWFLRKFRVNIAVL